MRMREKGTVMVVWKATLKSRGIGVSFAQTGVPVISPHLECTGVCGTSQQEAQRGEGFVGPEMVTEHLVSKLCLAATW